MAYTKLPLSITDQIALLKSRGLSFADEAYAAQVLEHESHGLPTLAFPITSYMQFFVVWHIWRTQ